MSFFDDLKKPEQKPKTTVPTGCVFTDNQRQMLVGALCSSILSGCTSAKKLGKRSYHGYCVWHMSEHYNDYGASLRPEAWIMSSWGSRKNEELCQYCTQAERDQFLLLMRKRLIAEGFPANVLRPCDRKATGGWFFNENMIYCIEVDVKW